MKTPMLTVDAIIIFQEGIVLVKRARPPHQGHYALPGGFVEVGEPIEDAVCREAKEETGLDLRILKLVGVYSAPNRDPRGHVVSICYLAWGRGQLQAGSDAKDAMVFSLEDLPTMAFDHRQMIDDAMNNY